MRAFTLVEILIVIAIIAILLGISIPAFRAYKPNMDLDGSTRKLVTDLRYAEQLTVTQQVLYCLIIIPNQKKYQIAKCDSSQIISSTTLPSTITSISDNFTQDKVQFNPYGAVKQAGQIILQNTKGASKTIEVKPSGFVSVS